MQGAGEGEAHSLFREAGRRTLSGIENVGSGVLADKPPGKCLWFLRRG